MYAYDERNLKEEDRKAIGLMEEIIDEAINATEVEETGIPSVDKLMDDVAEKIKENVRANFEALMKSLVVSIIEGYEEEEGEREA